MKEDELLSRLEMLENQLQVYAKVMYAVFGVMWKCVQYMESAVHVILRILILCTMF